MERALHPELAKRMISTDPNTGRSQFNHIGAMTLVQTREGIGKRIAHDRQLKEVTILDRFNNAAVVKIVASDWVDYLEVAKFNGDWKIINVLWELKPKP
jgi:Putative lumazine-binding